MDPTKAVTIDATIPAMVWIGVKTVRHTKNTVRATIKTAKTSYVPAIALETLGLFTMLISVST
jgi:hypothetical protein